MKIAMMTNNYKPFVGGVPISVERLAESLRRIGHQVIVFAPEAEGGGPEEDTVRFKTLYQKKEKGLAIGNCFGRCVEKSFKKEGFDLIHVHHPVVSGHAALYFSKKYSIPVVYTYHTRYEQYLHYFKFYEELAARAYPLCEISEYGKSVLLPKYISMFANECDLVFAPTPAMRKHLLCQGVEAEIAVLPTGIGNLAFQCDKKHAAEIRSGILEGRRWLFATTARLEKEKNLDFLLHGLARLKALAGDCFKMAVLGDGTEREKLTALTHELGISENVVFVGTVPNTEVRHYLHGSDLFLFASKSETQGIVLLEAMAAGCPVVAVRASGVCDVVEHGKNGYMTREEAELWAEAVYCLMKDEGTCERFSKAAVMTAENYRAEAVAREAERQYQKVLERSVQHEHEGTVQKAFMPALLRLFKTA